nr:MAG TPA: RNA polymerase sigma-E factor [Caudoviricetes sp.]
MDGKIKSIFEIARGMTDKEISEKYGITEDDVNAIKCMNPKIFEKDFSEMVRGDETIVKAVGDKTPVVTESLKIVVPTKEFYEDLQYLVDDFAKVKSTLVYKEDLTPQMVAIIVDNYEEKLQRFQKRYGNVEK